MGLFDFLRNLFGAPRPRSLGPTTIRTARPASRLPQQPSATNVVPPKPPPPQPKSLNLDAKQFAPISSLRAKLEASTLVNIWSSGWFGRRDVIPPAADRRTSIIDRAMVGAGLTTPEELAEIHRAGDEMMRLKPDLALAEQQANEALQRSREERQALKQQKKREAAERDRLRKEAVANRKSTDIIFLGRGVSKGLADRRANVEKLQAGGLPVLATPADIAAALGIPITRLRWLAFHSEAAARTHYIHFSVPKKSGGLRELCTPHKTLARCQEWILTQILEKISAHESAHGFVHGRNTVSNARPHVRQAAVINVDMKDFFPTITFRRVGGIFKSLGYSPAASAILALLCTEAPRRIVEYAGKTFHVATGPRALPQGACTSPALSNLAARGMDSRFAKLSAKLNWTYTRYADDLTFSARAENVKQSGYLLARVRHIAQDEGFTINEKKTRIQRAGNQQTVTGIVVNKYPNIPRRELRRLRALLHRAKKEGLAAQNRENRPHFESWLRGMISYVSMVNAKQGQALRVAFNAVRAQK